MTKRYEETVLPGEVLPGELPLISVIVPVYNIEECLERCVGSLTAQTYGNLEILLVDDGSTDKSGALCDALAARDNRIRVFHKENGGSSSARNLGIREARGQYLGFVDSDDYVDPDMYECLYRGICFYQVKVSQIGRDEIGASGEPLPDICVPPLRPVLYESDEFLRELLLHRGDCSFCTKLLHRELFAGEGFPEGRLNEDFNLLVRMLPRIGSLVSLPGHCYHVYYRIGSNSRKADRDSFSRVYGDCVDNADMVEALVEERYPGLRGEALRFGVFQRLEYLLHIPIGQMKRDNGQYRAVVRGLRRRWLRSLGNPCLTGKNKLYHTIFSLCPAGARKIHRFLKKML